MVTNQFLSKCTFLAPCRANSLHMNMCIERKCLLFFNVFKHLIKHTMHSILLRSFWWLYRLLFTFFFFSFSVFSCNFHSFGLLSIDVDIIMYVLGRGSMTHFPFFFINLFFFVFFLSLIPVQRTSIRCVCYWRRQLWIECIVRWSWCVACHCHFHSLILSIQNAYTNFCSVGFD